MIESGLGCGRFPRPRMGAAVTEEKQTAAAMKMTRSIVLTLMAQVYLVLKSRFGYSWFPCEMWFVSLQIRERNGKDERKYLSQGGIV